MLLFIRRYAPFTTFGGGFEGDIRNEASTLPTSTARTIGVVMFGQEGVIGYHSFSDGTRFLKAGPWLAGKIGRKFSIVKSSVTKVLRSSNSISFTVFTAGANPLIPFHAAPDIDTYVDLTVRFGSHGNCQFVGRVRGDSFPNAEVFVVGETEKQSLLFDFRTAGNATIGPTRLIGEHATLVLGTFAVNVVGIGPAAPVQITHGS